MKDIYGNDFIKNQPMERILVSEKELDSFGCIEGDLLFGRTSLTLAGVGDCCLIGDVNDVPIFESNLIRIRFNKNIANPKFYYYYFKSKIGKSAIQKIAKQTAAASITGTDLVNISVNYPSLEEQNLICNFLWPLEHRVELLRETNTTLEAIAQALFKSWFVDFDPVHAKQQGRAPEGMDAQTAALFPDSFEASELGMVPKGWMSTTFFETIQIVGGGTPKTSNPDFWGGSIPWYSVVDAPNESDVFVIDTEKKITTEGLNGSSTKLLPKLTTIISARGTVGKLALTGCEMAMNQSCYGLRSKKDAHFFNYFSTKRLVSSLKQKAHGSVFDTITQETFKGVDVVLPSVDILAAFENFVEPLFARVLKNLQQAKSLSELRDTLLPRLISGQLRLPEAQALVEEAVDG